MKNLVTHLRRHREAIRLPDLDLVTAGRREAILGAEGGAGIAGDAGVGAGGGAILTLIVGLIKKAMAGDSAAAGDA